MLQPNDIRLFIRDRPELNRLLGKEEFTQEEVDQAMKLAVLAFNEMSPPTQYSVENFPYPYVLLIGTVYHLFFSGGVGRSRNRLAYNASGVQIDDEAFADTELQLAQHKSGQRIRAIWDAFDNGTALAEMPMTPEQKIDVLSEWGSGNPTLKSRVPWLPYLEQQLELVLHSAFC